MLHFLKQNIMQTTIVKTTDYVLNSLADMISGGEKISKMIELYSKPIHSALIKRATEEIKVTSEKITFDSKGQSFEIYKAKASALIESEAKEGQYYFCKKNHLYWLCKIIEDNGIKYGVFYADGHTEGDKVRTPKGLFSENELPATKVIPLADLSSHFIKVLSPKFEAGQIVKSGRKLYKVVYAVTNKDFSGFNYVCNPYKNTYKRKKNFDTTKQEKFTADQLK